MKLLKSILQDLGRAAYVFSDKTGTLTSNEMRLRGIAIKGQSFGSLDFRCVPLCTSLRENYVLLSLPNFLE